MEILLKLLLSFLLVYFQSFLPPKSPTNTSPPNFYPVVSITDGDTFKVSINNQVETVRVVGIDTPETVDPRQPVQCFGKEASLKMTELISNKLVRIETDAAQSNRDRYQRLLRFVFLPDGTDVGLELIRLGYAQSVLFSPDPHQYYDAYESAEAEAKQLQLGLWNPNSCTINITTTKGGNFYVQSLTQALIAYRF